MTKILFLHRHSLDPEGRGGHHRSYQIFIDLQARYGSEVSTLALESLIGNNPARRNSRFIELKKRLLTTRLAVKRGFKPEKLLNELLAQKGFAHKAFPEIPVDSYKEYVIRNGKPDICVVDLPVFLPIIRLNHELGIKTIYCPQNVDSLDMWAHTLNLPSSRAQCALHWLVELEALALCDERWMISKLETALIQGLGMSAIYYPYLPIGEIRERLMGIRAFREENPLNSRKFLMLGSITHRTTYESFRWFLENIQEKGLPEGIQLIVAGRGGEKLESEFSTIPGIQFRGLLPQHELNQLLNQTSLVLLPQISGFGAVTRISEMACAGIPVIASQHTLSAMNFPPGVAAQPNDFNAWINATKNVHELSRNNSLEAYEAWELRQPNPVREKTLKGF